MNPFTNHRIGFHGQRGTTLIVVLVLILLATVMGLFAVNVNLSEQRASGNDVRTRLMRESAEAGLAQGMAYMQSLTATQRDPFANSANWTQCTASDTSFPCGAMPVDDGLSPAHARRANMFYYSGNTGNAMQSRMLPLTGRMTELTTVGNGFDVQYGVGALLCVLKRPDPSIAYPPGPPVECATNAAEESGTSAMTLVSVGSIPGESAHVTLSQSVGAYLRVSNPPGAPPIVASGSADLTGGFQVVTNPNAAGTGVPISVWTRGAVSKTGTSNTCQYDEFIRDGQGGNATADLEPPVNYSGSPPVTPADQIMRCDQCTCIGPDSLSFSKSGNSGQLGIDVLQCSSGAGTCDGTQQANPGANFDIKADEFPCDLFQYVFGTKGHRDANGDNFCEKQITTQAKLADGNTYTLGADEAYLYSAADHIIPTSANAAKVSAAQTGTCAQLNSASASGFWWDQTGSCTLTGSACLGVGVGGKGNNSDCVGSITFPVLVVGDGAVQIQGATVFGFVFVRSTGSADLDPATGGNATYSMNAKSTLYGAIVVQGTVTKVNGSAAVIYNSKVLNNLINNSLPPSWATVPGGWSDRFSY